MEEQLLRQRLVTAPAQPLQVVQWDNPTPFAPLVQAPPIVENILVPSPPVTQYVMVAGPAPIKMKKKKKTQHHDVKTQKHPPDKVTDTEGDADLPMDPFLREDVDDTHQDVATPPTLEQSLQFETELQSKEFLAILIFTLFGAIIFMLNASVNDAIVTIENRLANGLSMGWFLVINLIAAVLIAHMVYRPYIIERSLGRTTVMIALILYVLAEMFWSLVLFHSRINRGSADLAAVLLLAATVWLGWVCYQYSPNTIFIFILLLAWCFYLIDYTFSVDSHPWRAVPFTG